MSLLFTYDRRPWYGITTGTPHKVVLSQIQHGTYNFHTLLQSGNFTKHVPVQNYECRAHFIAGAVSLKHRRILLFAGLSSMPRNSGHFQSVRVCLVVFPKQLLMETGIGHGPSQDISRLSSYRLSEKNTRKFAFYLFTGVPPEEKLCTKSAMQTLFPPGNFTEGSQLAARSKCNRKLCSFDPLCCSFSILWFSEHLQWNLELATGPSQDTSRLSSYRLRKKNTRMSALLFVHYHCKRSSAKYPPGSFCNWQRRSRVSTCS